MDIIKMKKKNIKTTKQQKNKKIYPDESTLLLFDGVVERLKQ